MSRDSTGRSPGVRADELLACQVHRPFPLPPAPWLAQQQWLDVLFLHWEVPADVLRPHVPAPLALDLAGGSAWIGVVPFQVRGLRPRSLPGVPGATDFLELNVRTYVTHGGRAGVFFFSLDASSLLAVLGARGLFRLPYHEAVMQCDSVTGGIVYRSERRSAPEVRFRGHYHPEGDVFTAAPGTLDHFLTERYCLFTASRGAVHRVDIQHPPWPLQRARAELVENGMALPLSLKLDAEPAAVHYAAWQPVLNWFPVRDA